MTVGSWFFSIYIIRLLQTDIIQSSRISPARSKVCLHFLAMLPTSLCLAGYAATAFSNFLCQTLKESFSVSSSLNLSSAQDHGSAQLHWKILWVGVGGLVLGWVGGLCWACVDMEWGWFVGLG